MCLSSPMQNKRDLGPHINVPWTKRRGKGKEGRHWERGWGEGVPAGEAIVQGDRGRGPRALGLDKVGSDGRAGVVCFHPASLEGELGLALVCSILLLLGRGQGRGGGLGAFPGKDGVDWEGPIMSSRSPIKTLAIV